MQVLAIDDALAVAEGEGQDLVEVSPLAKPPVCRLQDFNKAKYAAKLREKVRPLAHVLTLSADPHNCMVWPKERAWRRPHLCVLHKKTSAVINCLDSPAQAVDKVNCTPSLVCCSSK